MDTRVAVALTQARKVVKAEGKITLLRLWEIAHAAADAFERDCFQSLQENLNGQLSEWEGLYHHSEKEVLAAQEAILA